MKISTRKFLPIAIAMVVLFFGCEISNSPGAFELTTNSIPEEGGTIDPPGGTFGANSEVTLEATPSEGYIFVEWTGDLSGTDNPATLTLNKDKEVNAVFAAREYPLNIEIRGQGTVREEVLNQKDDYEYGTAVQLTAEADAGWEFVRWEGDLEGNENPAVITVEGETNVTAVFEQTTFILTTNTVGEGSILEEIEEEPMLAANKSTYQEPVNTPPADLKKGRGSLNPDEGTDTDMTGPKSAAKNKVLQTGEYEDGTIVKLTAEAADGWQFIRWEGDLDGTENPVSIEMTENKEVTAVFSEESDEPQINISTNIITDITMNSAVSGGTITADEGLSVIARGVCYSQTSTPDMDDNCTINGAGEGSFTSSMSGLNAGTTYYVRAYAITGVSTNYGNERSFTTVALPDRYEISVATEGQGSVDLDPDQQDYEDGSSVTLTAIPDNGWTFSHWEGDLQGTDNPETITMDENKNVTAVFEAIDYTIDIDISGEGSVNLDPEQSSYQSGTNVTLTAVPAEGWTFSHWEGDLQGTDNPETITVDENKEITAVFESIDFTIDVTINGEGTVNFDPDQTTFTAGTEVTLTAVPADGWTFSHWEGDLTGEENPASITMDEDKEVTAVFEAIDFTIDVAINGEGTVNFDPDQTTFSPGTEVTLTAVPAEGWTFSHWEGDLTGEENPASITMDEDKAVTAVFETIDFTIQTNVEGDGTIELDPDQENYPPGTEVSVSAIASEGWDFSHWEGDLTGEENTATLTMDSDKNITAVFETAEFSIETTTTGEGTINLDPDQPTYPAGTEVTITAAPAEGWEFSQWEGDLAGTANPEVVTINENLNITAVFEELVDDPDPSESTVSHGYVEGVTPENMEASTASRTYPVIQADWPGPGGDKRWLAWNIGATDAPTSINDNNPERAGWYFQFNRLQGYYHDGEGDESIENFPVNDVGAPQDPQFQTDWIDNDPCTELLGESWRIPTLEEWRAVADANAAERLNLHFTGSVSYNLGALFGLGEGGSYWTSTHYEEEEGANAAYSMQLNETYNLTEVILDMRWGMTIRCLEARA